MSAYRVSALRLRRRVLQVLADQAAPPVDLNIIAATANAQVQVRDLAHDLSAIVHKSDGHATIVIGSHQRAVEQRFAIARQLGRLLLHRLGEVSFDTGARISLNDPRGSDLAGLDALEATWFGLELLLPHHWLADELDGDHIDLQDGAAIDRLAAKYEVASHLLLYRLATFFS